MHLLDELKHLFVLLYTRIETDMPVHASHSQVKVLHYLIHHQDASITQKDIEHHLGLSRATVSGILKTMEKHQLVTRGVSNKDTRIKTVQITPKAITNYEVAATYFQTLQNQMCEGISDDELTMFKHTLTKMHQNLNRKDDHNA